MHDFNGRSGWVSSTPAKSSGDTLPDNVVSLLTLGPSGAARQPIPERRSEWVQLRWAEAGLVQAEVSVREWAFDTLVLLSGSNDPFVVKRACSLMRKLARRDLRFDDRAGVAIRMAMERSTSPRLREWLREL